MKAQSWSGLALAQGVRPSAGVGPAVFTLDIFLRNMRVAGDGFKPLVAQKLPDVVEVGPGRQKMGGTGVPEPVRGEAQTRSAGGVLHDQGQRLLGKAGTGLGQEQSWLAGRQSQGLAAPGQPRPGLSQVPFQGGLKAGAERQ